MLHAQQESLSVCGTCQSRPVASSKPHLSSLSSVAFLPRLAGPTHPNRGEAQAQGQGSVADTSSNLAQVALR